MACGKAIVTTLSGEQRPWPADPGSIKRRSVLMFAIPIAAVTIPARTLRHLDGEQRIDGAKRVQNVGIFGRPQAKTDQGERVRTDDVIRAVAILARRLVLDGNKALRRRCGTIRVGRGYSDVVPFHAQLLRQISPRGIHPAL